MAISEAAIPLELARNSRRLTPSFFEVESASSLIRASTSFCFSDCGFGRYSPFDTFCVGIGEQKSSDSASYAREHLLSSSGDIQVLSDTAHPPLDSKRTATRKRPMRRKDDSRLAHPLFFPARTSNSPARRRDAGGFRERARQMRVRRSRRAKSRRPLARHQRR